MTASRLPATASIRHSTASSPNFCATLVVPRESSRAEWLMAGSAPRRLTTTDHRRSRTAAAGPRASGGGRSGGSAVRAWTNCFGFSGLASFFALRRLVGFTRPGLAGLALPGLAGLVRFCLSADLPMARLPSGRPARQADWQTGGRQGHFHLGDGEGAEVEHAGGEQP